MSLALTFSCYLFSLCFQVSSREGGQLTQTTETVEPAVTHDPLVVLVNNMSASASEIVSGRQGVGAGDKQATSTRLLEEGNICPRCAASPA
jgi:hypothetical protein